MQVTETLSEGLKRGYTVVVAADDLEAKRQAKLAELARGLRLPGFRPGKVPASVVRQRYGSAVIAEVLQESVSEATERMVADRGLRPAVPPKVDVVAPGLGQAESRDLEFKVELELLPEIKIPDFSAIRLTRLKAEPDEAELGRTLERIAASSASLEPITEERGAAKGEVLTVDFAGEADGKPIAGGSATGAEVEVGGVAVGPGFSEQLEGMRPGETRAVTVTYPPEFDRAPSRRTPSRRTGRTPIRRIRGRPACRKRGAVHRDRHRALTPGGAADRRRPGQEARLRGAGRAQGPGTPAHAGGI